MRWEEVKDRIHERLLSSEWQPDMLAVCVKIGASADVWRTWYIDIGNGVISAVTYELMRALGVCIRDLEEAAIQNDAGRYVLKSLTDMIGGILHLDVPEEEPCVYVVTNSDGWYGAAGILDTRIQESLDRIFEDGYYVLPSSVHECIAVPKSADVSELVHMVRDINRAQVAEHERLSDHVFAVVGGKLAAVA